jgi:hypothetical protein
MSYPQKVENVVLNTVLAKSDKYDDYIRIRTLKNRVSQSHIPLFNEILTLN